MAIHTKIFPIAAIRGIVVVITVLVVDGQKMQIFQLEFPATLGANPAVQLQGAFSIVFAGILFSLEAPHRLIDLCLAFGSGGPTRTGFESSGHLRSLLTWGWTIRFHFNTVTLGVMNFPETTPYQ